MLFSDLSVREANCDKVRGDRISRLRRAWFIAIGSTVAIGVPCALALLGYESPLAIKVVDGMLGYAELLALLYLGSQVIDRSQILHRIGGRWDRMEERSSTRRDGERGYGGYSGGYSGYGRASYGDSEYMSPYEDDPAGENYPPRRPRETMDYSTGPYHYRPRPEEEQNVRMDR